MSAPAPEEAVEQLGAQAEEQSAIVARLEAQLRRALHDGEQAAKRLGPASERLHALRRRHAEAAARLAAIDAHVADLGRARAASPPQRAELAALGPMGRLPDGPNTVIWVEEGGAFLALHAGTGSPQACSARELVPAASLPSSVALEPGMRRHFAIEHVRGGWFRVSERLAAFVLEVRHGHDVGWMMERILGGRA